MTAKEYLNQAYWLDRRIDSKLEQLSALKDMATKTTSIMSDDVVSRTRNVHNMEDVIAKIVDMQAEINADIDRLVDIKREVREMIEPVPSAEGRTILEMRYINYCKWKEIAVAMHYVLCNVRYIHDRSIEYLEIKSGE